MFSSSMANYTVLTRPIYHNGHSYSMLYMKVQLPITMMMMIMIIIVIIIIMGDYY